MRRTVLCLGVVLLLATLCRGAEDSDDAMKKLTFTVTKTRVVYSSKRRPAKLYVSGTTRGLAPQMKLGIVLTYNFAEVGRCLATIGNDGSFSEVPLEPTMSLPPDTTYELAADLRVEDQAPRLKEPMEKLLAASVYGPFLTKLEIGTVAERKKARSEVVSFVKKLLQAAVAANNELIDEVEAAEKGLKYQSAGSFDTKAWREFIDKQWRLKIIKLQGAYERWVKKNPAYKFRYRTGADYLGELLRTVAARSVIRSKNLYNLNRKKLALEDVTLPAGFAVDVRYAKIGRSDKRAKSHLMRCYKFVQEDFKLVKPKKKPVPKKAPAKTGGKKQKSEKKGSSGSGKG